MQTCRGHYIEMLHMGKFGGRKGCKKKLSWFSKAEIAFEKLKDKLLGELGLVLVHPDKGLYSEQRPRTTPWG